MLLIPKITMPVDRPLIGRCIQHKDPKLVLSCFLDF